MGGNPPFKETSILTGNPLEVIATISMNVVSELDDDKPLYHKKWWNSETNL